MKIAISNLSWDHKEDNEILKILNKYQIKGIELAPSKVWKDPTSVNFNLLKRYKKFWSDNGISIVATTSLLFGHPELTIFENREVREKTLGYLTKMLLLSASLDARVMVFGSPRNRNTYGLAKGEVSKIAQDFFYSISELAKKHNIFFGIEPNPKEYGTDFVNTTLEAQKLVEEVSHPNFKIHLDSGAMTMNNEDYKEAITKCLPYICHFHISEPMLKPINPNSKYHQTISTILKSLNYDKWVSVEMPLKTGVNHGAIIDQTLKLITSLYN